MERVGKRHRRSGERRPGQPDGGRERGEPDTSDGGVSVPTDRHRDRGRGQDGEDRRTQDGDRGARRQHDDRERREEANGGDSGRASGRHGGMVPQHGRRRAPSAHFAGAHVGVPSASRGRPRRRLVRRLVLYPPAITRETVVRRVAVRSTFVSRRSRAEPG